MITLNGYFIRLQECEDYLGRKVFAEVKNLKIIGETIDEKYPNILKYYLWLKQEAIKALPWYQRWIVRFLLKYTSWDIKNIQS